MTVHVFDFFAGCGGTSKGFQATGMDIAFALDSDADAIQTYKLNFPGTDVLCKDITKVNVSAIQKVVDTCRPEPLLFCGCAPCQPFTKQNTSRPEKDNRSSLLLQFLRFVVKYKPEFVFVENVPGIQNVGSSGSFQRFCKKLSHLGYFLEYDVVLSKDYGVPQRRRRLVLIASMLGEISFPKKTHGPKTKIQTYSTVRDWIEDLPPIEAGEICPRIRNHRAAKLSEINLKRISLTPEGGDRRDWPKELHLKCHSKEYKGHSDVYGRMKWNEPASGLTTRCISLSNGRFGHPSQNRAISIREAACLQTFPRSFVFSGSMGSIAKQIGNAVPVLLAEQFGKNFLKHYKKPS